jgi:pyruvate dehydrogenase E2 component (dihydrolipoamide acetyltransferase)
MLGAETPAALRRALDLLGGGPVSDAALAAELAVLRRNRAGQRALAAEIAAGGIQQIDLAAEIDGLGAPMAALFGTADRIADWQGCARLPARVAIHLRAGVGHLPHVGAEALVDDLILPPGAAPI